MLEGVTVDSLMNKIARDKQIIMVMEILELLCNYAFYVNLLLLRLFTFRLIQLSIRHGVCASTAYGFGGYGALLCSVYHDVKGGNKYGKLTLKIMDFHQRCRVTSILYGYVFPRIEHLSLCQEPILKAYHESIKIRDTEFAMLNAGLFSTLSFQGGRELSFTNKFLDNIGKLVKEYKQESSWQLVLPLKQAILNLMGEADNPARLEGGAMSFKEYLSVVKENHNMQALHRLYLYQMRVAYIFGDLELAAKMAKESHAAETIFHGKFEACEYIFYSGLISCVKARKINESKWETYAKECIKKMEKWAEDAPCNCEHKLHLLEAELYFFKGTTNKAIDKYESAILLSGRNGFIQDQAISYERASIFYLENRNDSRASNYYGKAHNAYLDWGAKGKAIHLCENSPF